MSISAATRALGAVVLGGLLLASATGCVTAGDEDLFARIDAATVDPNECTEVIDFQAEVVPILAANCSAIGVCHGDTSGIGLVLTETTAFDSLVDAPSTQSDKVLVAPGSAAGSWLIDKLTAQNGASLMPPGGALPEEDVQRVACWITQGANP
jgi:hypothetical protein